MKCSVCFANFPGASKCPSCGYDHTEPNAKDSAHVLKAREEFKARTLAYAPDTRVSSFDKARPWIGLGIGFALFVVWLQTCTSMGWNPF